MKVREVMSTPPVTCRTSSSLSDAAAAMWRNDCGALPVVDEHDTAVGMITDRDICIAVGTRAQRASEIPVQSVITGHLSYVRPDDDLATVFASMERDRVHRLPVLDEQAHVVGVVSLNDLVLRAGDVARDAALEPTHVIATLRQISAHWLPEPTTHVKEVEAAPMETPVDGKRAGATRANGPIRRRGRQA